jgi:RimJ/RimL family protein N-acetyltransferase
MMMKAITSSVSVRDISENEIPSIIDYWFHSPVGFLESMGVDPLKMPREVEMRASLYDKITANLQLGESKINAMAILFNGKAIGFHTLNPIVEGDYAIFHAHIWDASARGLGIATQSYPKACQTFIERFNLNRILFKTPAQNKAAIKVKEKLGIRCIGEEIVGFGIIKEGTLAKVFELTKFEAKNLILENQI